MKHIRIKRAKDIQGIRASSKITAELIVELEQIIRPGISTAELDAFAQAFINKKGAVSAFKGYNGYPATLCTSINSEVVHGIPKDSVILKEGDILKIDTGVVYKGYFSDMAKTFIVGGHSACVDEKVRLLLKTTENALYAGIEKARAGCRLSQISNTIYSTIRREDFRVIRELTGHGVGFDLHEPPTVYNYPNKEANSVIIREGLVLAVEPMASISCEEVVLMDDGWTYVTADGSISAHFEHTIAIVEGKAVILTSLELDN